MSPINESDEIYNKNSILEVNNDLEQSETYNEVALATNREQEI
jgi:hypothetical protein